MPIRILSHDDVHRCLPPRACAEAMREALAALARGESSFPLRSVFRPEGSPGFLGLMPGFRGGSQPAVRAEGRLHLPGEPGQARDRRAPGRRAPVRRRDRRADGRRRRRCADRRSARRPSPPSRRGRSRGRTSSELAVLGAGSQARAHIAALADTLPLERVRVMSRTFAHARALADELSPALRVLDRGGAGGRRRRARRRRGRDGLERARADPRRGRARARACT